MKENEQLTKQDSGLPSRPLNCSTACKQEFNLVVLSIRELQVYFGIAEASGDDLTCLAILDEANRRKFIVTE
jgi:hypothetical protein